MSAMDVERISSRSHAYALFGHLLLEGITPSTLPIIQQLDDLAGVLPQPVDIMEAAAAHEQVLGMNVFANESIFLDVTGLVGGGDGCCIGELSTGGVYAAKRRQ
ncbi:MAG: hypothetical protein R3A44_08400 [Caldilineaceae bacterium]